MRVILGVIIQTQRHLSKAAETEGKGKYTHQRYAISIQFGVLCYLWASLSSNRMIVAENKTKYKLWGSFYIITVVYIYLTRIIIQLLKVSLPYQYVDWLVELLNEVITLGFYITIGLVFLSTRPFARVS